MNEVMIVQIIYVFRDKEEDPPDTGELLALQQQCNDTIGGLLRHLKWIIGGPLLAPTTVKNHRTIKKDVHS